MTEKRFSVRFSAEGGDRIQAELVGIGEAGSRSLHEIDQSALEVEAALARMAQQAGQSRTVLRGIGDTRVALSNVTVEQAKSARASAEVFQETERLRASYNSLRGSLDPLHAATIQYEQAQEELAEAVRRGVVPQTEARQVQALLQREYQETTARIAATGRAAGVAGAGGVRQLAMQMSQVAQQGQVTGNYLQALSIQAADIGMAFGTWGIAAGVAVGVLTPLLAQFFQGRQRIADFDAAMESLNETMRGIDENSELLQMTVRELSIEYGDAATRVRAFALASSELRVQQLNDQLSDQVSVLERVTRQYRMVNSSEVGIFESGTMLSTAIGNVARDFQVTTVEARELAGLFRDMAMAETFTGQQDVLVQINDAFERMGVEAENIPRDLRDAFLQMIELSNASDRARQNAEGLRELTTFLSFDAAARSAAEMARHLGISLSAAQQIVALQNGPNLGRGGDPRQQGGSLIDWRTRNVPDSALQDPDQPGRGGGSSPEEVSAAYRMAAESIRQAEQASVTFAMVQAELNEMLREGEINGVEYASALEIARERLTEAGQASEFWESQSRSVIDAIAAGESLAEVWDSVAQSIRRAVIELILFNEGPFAVQGGFSGLFNAFSGSLFGGGSGGSVKRFASGGVVNSATYFAMAGGIGEMGEAGPEAIMPLERVGGKLGVRAAGGGGAVVMKTEIHNHVPGAQVTEEESTGPDGERIKRFHVNMHRRALAEGEFDGVMRGKYGAETRTVRR